MRRIDLLITQSRRATENSEYSEGTGISDEEFLQYMNDGQDRILGLILSARDTAFNKKSNLTMTSGTREYSIPTDCYSGARVNKVWVTNVSSPDEDDWEPLTQNKDFDIQGKKIVLLSDFGNGLLRVSYQRKLPRLDKRRAKVSAVTLASGQLTALTLDTTVELDATTLAEEGYLTLVDKDGTVQMKSVPVSSINTTTGVVTLDGTLTYESGETAAAGNWVCAGKNSTTHSELDDLCERYLVAYCNWKILKRDSSNDSREQTEELSMMETEIVDTFREADFALDSIPIISGDFITSEE
jgi:hypothetical protein